MIPYGRQEITDRDIEAVVDVLRSDLITQGPMVPQFESSFAKYCGSQYAVAVNNATAGLHIACKAVGLQPGDALWTTPNTFVASANVATYCGADIDFVDIEPDTHNMSIDRLAMRLEHARDKGRLPKIVMPVHFAGHPCDLVEMAKLAAEYGFHVIEDAAHAIGAQYRGDPVGQASYSDAAVFSLHPVKIITSGEGGVVTGADGNIVRRCERMRSHGITREVDQMEQPEADAPWYYEMIEPGYNYRMTDFQAALGQSQLERIESYVDRRREIASIYERELSDLDGICLPVEREYVRSSWHLYVINVTAGPERRKRLFNRLRADGLGVQVHYIPVHSQPYYRDMGFAEGMFPEAERHYDTAISLPIYPAMTSDDVDKVIDVVRKANRTIN